MPKIDVRRAKTPRLAALLRSYRVQRFGGEKTLGLAEVRMRQLGFTGFDRSTIWQYERSHRQPHPAILWGLAQVYRVEFNPLLALLLEEVTGGLVKAEWASPPPLSVEAEQLARAFESADPKTKRLVRLALAETAAERRPEQSEQVHDPLAAASGSHGRARKSRRHP